MSTIVDIQARPSRRTLTSGRASGAIADMGFLVSAFADTAVIARFDMLEACDMLDAMSVMIQIRNVPEALHRKLKSHAALAGQSLSDYLLAEVRELAERPTLEELMARLKSRTSITPSVDPVAIIREERDRP